MLPRTVTAALLLLAAQAGVPPKKASTGRTSAVPGAIKLALATPLKFVIPVLVAPLKANVTFWPRAQLFGPSVAVALKNLAV